MPNTLRLESNIRTLCQLNVWLLNSYYILTWVIAVALPVFFRGWTSRWTWTPIVYCLKWFGGGSSQSPFKLYRGNAMHLYIFLQLIAHRGDWAVKNCPSSYLFLRSVSAHIKLFDNITDEHAKCQKCRFANWQTIQSVEISVNIVRWRGGLGTNNTISQQLSLITDSSIAYSIDSIRKLFVFIRKLYHMVALVGRWYRMNSNCRRMIWIVNKWSDETSNSLHKHIRAPHTVAMIELLSCDFGTILF